MLVVRHEDLCVEGIGLVVGHHDRLDLLGQASVNEVEDRFGRSVVPPSVLLVLLDKEVGLGQFVQVPLAFDNAKNKVTRQVSEA